MQIQSPPANTDFTSYTLLRSAEDFGGVVAANPFQEFWADIKKRLFHKRN